MNKKTNSLTKLLPYIKPYKWGIIITILMILVTTMTFSITPMFEGQITTQLVQDVANMNAGLQASISFDIIFKVLMFLAILYGIKTLSQAIMSFTLTNAIQNSMHDLRKDLEAKIHQLPVSYFDTHQYGDILSRMTNDVDTVSNALQQTLTNILSGALSLILAIAMMFKINGLMTGIVLLLIPASLLITKTVVHYSQKKFKAQQDALGKLNGTITEMYSGYQEIILYNRQEQAKETFSKTNQTLCENAFKAQFLSSLMSPLISLCTYLCIGSVAVVGSLFAMQGTITVGNLQAFVRYIWQVNDPLSQISSLSSQIQSAFTALSRIFEVLEEKEEVADVAHPTILKQPQGNVSFEHVKFGYNPQNILINDLNATIKAGQMVAIVGPTGAGKTTLINLLMRFYDVLDGAIKIDGVDIRDMKRDDLRQLFGMVLQDTWLFSDSIYENLRYGRIDATNDEIIEASKMANVDHFIRTLPDGYHTIINEEANNISQGEKQLLTIARAILKEPQILILDEATSSVDTRIEKMLQEAMHNVMQGRTSFVIAHRLSTIKKADLILVIDHGEIVEQGTHESLMAKQGYYEKLYNSQFANQEE